MTTSLAAQFPFRVRRHLRNADGVTEVVARFSELSPAIEYALARDTSRDPERFVNYDVKDAHKIVWCPK